MTGKEEKELGTVKDTKNRKIMILINIVGAFATLLGLAEITRLVAQYWGTYGLLANFPLEISIYIIGAVWTFSAFINFVSPNLNFLSAVRRINPKRS